MMSSLRLKLPPIRTKAPSLRLPRPQAATPEEELPPLHEALIAGAL